MKNATTYLGIALLGTLLMSFSGKPDCKTNCEPLPIDDITYIEPTEDFELDFDTAQYLPEGFNAYKGMEADLTDVTFVENEEEIELGFNSAKYLPIGFDAYEGMVIELDDIEYIEEEEEVELDFNVQNYLPNNFNAYSR
ncbi:hypothetical protein [Pricia sp.]|uniref:hypothetical protein n=1 Tax=Pricia sp. TaxID=2268138 RepID=UPI003593B8A0